MWPTRSLWKLQSTRMHQSKAGGAAQIHILASPWCWGCGHERKRKQRLSPRESAQDVDCLSIIMEERRIRLASLGSRDSGEKQPLCCTAWSHRLYAVGLCVTKEQRRKVPKSPFYLFVVGGSLGSTLLLVIICDVYSIVAQLVTDQNWAITMGHHNHLWKWVNREISDSYSVRDFVFFLYAGRSSVMSSFVL